MIIHSCWVIKIEDMICLSVWLYSKTSCHHGVQNPWPWSIHPLPMHEDIPSSFGIYREQCQITTVAAQLKQSFAFRTSGLRFVLALR
jgi:murein endopeptidase